MIESRFVDVGIIIKDDKGYQTIVMQNGNTTDLSFPYRNANAKVGDKGNVYYESCSSYGMHKFEIDNNVNIDFDKMKENYKNRWNGELSLPEASIGGIKL